MNGVNLIPGARRAARVRRRQARLWCIGAVACGIALLSAHAALWTAWRAAGDDPAPEVARLTKDIVEGERLDRAARAKVLEAKAEARAAKEVSDQPDWGALMVFIADKLCPDAVLDSFHVEPVTTAPAAAGPKASPTPPPERGRRALVLTGLAKTQDGASQVAIELKRSELFRSVNLVETRRTVFMGTGGVAFRIECAIAGAGGGD